MNMGAPTAEADAGGIPRWVWLSAAGLAALAVLGTVLYLMATAPL